MKSVNLYQKFPKCNLCRLKPQFKRGNLAVKRVQEEELKELGVSKQELEDMALKILREDPEKAAQLERLAEAEQRVADLVAQQKKIQDEYEKTLKEVANDELLKEQKAKETAADLYVQAAEKQILVAKLELESAQLQKDKWQDEIAEDLEKFESVKAGLFAVVGGIITSIPLALVSDNNIASVAADVTFALVSCGLFGIVYRYALRQDINNIQLKGGVIAGFGLTRGLAAAQQIIFSNIEVTTEQFGQAALQLGSSMLLFAFAATALEFAIDRGYLVLFGQAKES